MTLPISALLASMRATACMLARRNKLVRNGVIWCWACSDYPALMPSLHCQHCLDALHHESANVPQTSEDARLASGSNHDQE